MNKKGQGTTEYLIILAVVIVIAVIVGAVLGWTPGLSTSITESQSMAYWKTAHPISIKSAKLISDGGMALVLNNKSTNKITVDSLEINGITVSNRGNTGSGLEKTFAGIMNDPNDPGKYNTQFTGGNDMIVNITHNRDLPDCRPGENISINLKIIYTTENGLSNIAQTGEKPLVVTCIDGINDSGNVAGVY